MQRVRQTYLPKEPGDGATNAHVIFEAIVLGDYLYIDGGEVSHLDNGKNSTDKRASHALNHTLSLPLNISWNNQTVAFNKIPKPPSVPSLNCQAAWRDPSGTAFYIWGGITSYRTQPPPSELWKFTADGYGGGSWNKHEKISSVSLGKHVRTSRGAWTQSKDVGYWLGGYGTANTDTSILPPQSSDGDKNIFLAVLGITLLKMASGELTNSSSVGMGPFGTLWGGSAHHVPLGGGGEQSDGLLVFLGGVTAPVLSYLESPDHRPVEFTNITVYDPLYKKWYSQQTTGAIPTPRYQICVVGVKGDNGTYEIFIYGGISWSSAKTPKTVGEVYVLSLPGFVFFKAPVEQTLGKKRDDHTCVVAGKRQMITIGGYDESLRSPDRYWRDPDPWSNGLGVFDLTEMRWSNEYNAAAEGYKSPAVVKTWYSEGGLESVAWSDNTLKRMFLEPQSTTIPPDQESSTPSDPSTGTSPSPSLEIVVGAVLGGVGGGTLLAAAAFLFYRHHRKRKPKQPRLSSPTETTRTKLYTNRWSKAPLKSCHLAQAPLSFQPTTIIASWVQLMGILSCLMVTRNARASNRVNSRQDKSMGDLFLRTNSHTR
uniref:Kelch repeat protein n=1 Tax=Podospora anserina (strain S / ATCC MYA-4624 / DSM 980 / FGSC 10383) TaxID=515849 RepID=A0A090DA55_PODAN|nr:Putative protein of unknown function [Podospora anserina S mat+]